LYGADKIRKGGKLGVLRAEFAAVELFNGFGLGNILYSSQLFNLRDTGSEKATLPILTPDSYSDSSQGNSTVAAISTTAKFIVPRVPA
jgi:hypothetical protein